jgi:Glycosyl transferase family 2
VRITTVIPAYKPKYLHELLTALYHQTVRPERIIFSDDSPDRAFRTALQSEAVRSAMAGMNIEVIDGPRAGAFANCRHLLQVWNGSTQLVHFLLDDDIIYPEFYERHLAVHAIGAVDCSVSRRWTSIEPGLPVGRLPVPELIARHEQRTLSLESDFLFSTTLPSCNNWLGELSHAVFNHEVSGLLDEPRLAGISFEGLGDIGFFLSASLRKPIGFLTDVLGYFRLNPAQNTQQHSSRDFKAGHLAWIALGLAAQRLNKLHPGQATQCFRTIGAPILKRFGDTGDMAPFCALLPALIHGDASAGDRFLELWQAFIDSR